MAPTNPWPKWPDPSRNATAAAVTTQDDDTKRVLLGEYNEHGAWARHFSGVRMTLGTFFLTASIGIIYQRWDKFDPWTAGLAAATLLIGEGLFLYFSRLTYAYVNRQRAIAEDYQTTLSPGPKKRPTPIPLLRRDVVYIAGGAAVFFAIVFSLWMKVGQPKPLPGGGTSPAPPVASRYAVTYSAVHQTNHGREAHTFLVDETTGNLWQMRCTPDDSVEFKGIQRDGKTPAKLSGQ